MLEFNSLCYLQNHKTGSTFVESFLRQFCKEPLLSYQKHAVVTQRVKGRFYFTNVREPLALYRSLFSYGLDGKGTVFLRLQRLEQGHLYESGPEGFGAWLAFVLAPRNAPLLSSLYTPRIAKSIGFMTWRFLRLACFGFERAAPDLADAAALMDYVQKHYFMKTILKQENLTEDLRALVRGPLAHCISDLDAALEWLAQSPKVNASVAIVDATSAPLDPALIERLVRKEGLLYRNFYPQVMAELLPRSAATPQAEPAA